jgi:Cd2+/Zn2+-exporting ATPase/Cu+-exporting ATPase
MTTIEVPIEGMDCVECTEHVQRALAAVPGVTEVEVLLASERAVIELDPDRVGMPELRQAVSSVGYRIPQEAVAEPHATSSRASLAAVGVLAVAVVLLAVVGEQLGWIEALSRAVPWFVWVPAVLAAGYPVFREVLLAARQRRIIAHTLMTMGVVAAALVGQWATALIVVFFMRVGDYIEGITVGRARLAVRSLMALAPQTARLERGEIEEVVPAGHIRAGDVVRVLPGEAVPVDGVVLSGQATVDQAAITGESMPVEVGPGATVFAASLASLGTLRVRATAVGPGTTFGKVVHMVEEAERGKGQSQRMADRFAATYLPIVLGVALITLIVRRDPLAAAAVLVVACSCAFTLGTPMAMLASIGTAARRGLLIKGGRAIEALDRARVALLDKTGTLTLGRPEIREIVALDGLTEDELLTLAAAAERYSEHPLAQAVRAAAHVRRLPLPVPGEFEAIPGKGVRAVVDGRHVEVGSERMASPIFEGNRRDGEIARLEAQGFTLLHVSVDGRPAGILAATDAERPEVGEALDDLRRLGFELELITGDRERTAGPLAERLGIDFRAGLLPEHKIDIVRQYQQQGRQVLMVGDGVNDAPALAQADVGIAMGSAGAAVAAEAASIALMRDDWRLIPEAVRVARRTMRVVRGNLIFTIAFNLVGLSLAALGILPPAMAAAAQSIPDLGIMANSSRLLR